MRNTTRLWWLQATALGALTAMTVVAYTARLHAVWLVSAYGIVATTRVLSQAAIAASVRRRLVRDTVRRPVFVSVVVAAFNETADVFERAMESLARQAWPAYEVIVIDDGSDDANTVRNVTEKHGFRYAYQTNAGKRHAMHRAFGMLDRRSRYVLTADSDTVWDEHVIADMVAGVQTNKAVAGTGFVDVLNPNENWLTRITSLRYWVAFQIERAAQSWFGVVTCISGPLGIYSRRFIDSVKDEFIAQTFMGRPCTFGDDRHLTNLALIRGYRVVYTRAHAYTEVPSSFPKYIRQQARWGKSHWREMFWTAKALRGQPIYLAYEWLLSALMPFLLLTTIGYCAVRLVSTGNAAYLLHLLVAALVMGMVRAVAAIVPTKDVRYLMLAPFGLFYMAVLLPLKFWSLVTMGRTHWGTRQATEAASGDDDMWPGDDDPTLKLPTLVRAESHA